MTLVWPRMRLEWREWLRSPLVIALLVSLALHFYVFFVAWLVPQLAHWKWTPAWLKPLVAAAPAAPKVKPAKPIEPVEVEIPLQFIEVDPALASPDAPKQARFTSTANTLAANPNPTKVNKPDPRIDGKREDTLKTFDTTRPSQPAQPVVPQDLQQQLAKDEVKAQEKGGPKAGDLVLARPTPDAKVDREQEARQAEQAQVPTPRQRKTVSQARAERGMLVGEQMRQEGGAPRVGVEPTFNVRSSHFGEYSSRLTAAVQAKWYALLDERHYALERTGHVVISFKLHPDGTVSAVNTSNSSMGELYSLLCELAVEQPAPFGRWPAELVHEIGSEPIPVTFTFNYFN